MSKAYGMELVLDLKNADTSRFTRENIESYLEVLCTGLGLERAELHFWDYEGDEEAKKQAPSDSKGLRRSSRSSHGPSGWSLS